MTAKEKVIQIAKNEVGYLEKKSNSNLDSKTANAGSANYTKYWRDIKPSYQGQPWCAAFITWCFVQAFGQAIAEKLLKHYPYVYCPTMANLFELHANPQVGDIVIFKRNGEFVHTGIVTYVNGDYFKTVEGNTSGGSTIVANGGGVFEKSYYNSNLPGTKFIRPNYSIAESEDNDMGKNYDEIINKMGEEIKVLQDKIYELENPMIYNFIDKNTAKIAPDCNECLKHLVNIGVLKGKDEGLALTEDMIRIYITFYRAGVYGE